MDAFPELTRVIVAYENRIVMEETLEEGSRELFARPASARRGRRRRKILRAPAHTVDAAAVTDLVRRESGLPALAAEAQRHYERAVQAQRAATGRPTARSFASSVRFCECGARSCVRR